MNSNPLLEKFDSVPFDTLKPEHFKPAIEILIKQANTIIDNICTESNEPTFENTLESLEFSTLQLNRVSSIFFNLNSAETNDEIQQIAQELSPMLSEFANDVRLNTALFKRIEMLYDKLDWTTLTKEQQRLMETNYKAFVRNGALLTEDKKKRLRAIDTELSQLKLKFGEHVLAETNNSEPHLTQKQDLKGLPDSIISAAAELAKKNNKEGWVFTLDYPSYVPFMTYSENRDLRKKMALTFGARGFQNNSNDNQQVVLDLVRLRHERAQLLGYESHAHFVLEERMAESPNRVMQFLNELLIKAKPAAEKDFSALEQLAKEDGIDQLQQWDGAFYSEKLKKKRFDLNQEALKPYFSLDKVLAGVFEIAHKLFGLTFEETHTVATYHDEVRTFHVFDRNGDYKALFYTDFFPRKGKRNGAWMTSYKSQWKKNGENSRPHVSIVCNFSRPTDGKPSLLTFNEVTTLFHEFGHALHGMMANTTYPNLSGTNVYWDFVELPSQLLENWCYEKDALHLFARHFKTDELIPMELVTKIREASNFLEGLQTLRQLSFGFLDMAWHGNMASSISNVKDLETKAFENTRFYPDVPENCMSTAFSHIFQGGYSSGYYSYKWAEVLDADVFESFLEKGIFNTDTADRFLLEILEKGGTENPLQLFRNFKNRDPQIDALLRRAGLVNSY